MGCCHCKRDFSSTDKAPPPCVASDIQDASIQTLFKKKMQSVLD